MIFSRGGSNPSSSNSSRRFRLGCVKPCGTFNRFSRRRNLNRFECVVRSLARILMIRPGFYINEYISLWQWIMGSGFACIFKGECLLCCLWLVIALSFSFYHFVFPHGGWFGQLFLCCFFRKLNRIWILFVFICQCTRGRILMSASIWISGPFVFGSREMAVRYPRESFPIKNTGLEASHRFAIGICCRCRDETYLCARFDLKYSFTKRIVEWLSNHSVLLPTNFPLSSPFRFLVRFAVQIVLTTPQFSGGCRTNVLNTVQVQVAK